MKYKSPLPGYLIGKRRKMADTLPSGLALPDYLMGGSTVDATTDYRLVDVLHIPKGMKDIKKGDTILVHELDKTPYQIDMSDRNIQVIPREKVMGVQDNKRTVHKSSPLENLKPLDNVVFGVYDEPEQETPGGIILPDVVKKEKLEATAVVTAIGPKCSEIKVGDRILIKKGYGCFFNFGGVKGIAIKEDEPRGMIGVLEEVQCTIET